MISQLEGDIMETIKEWQHLIAVVIAVVIFVWRFPTKADLTREINGLSNKLEETIRHIVRVEQKLDSHTNNYDVHRKDN